jgi:hypothetical protein
MADRASLDADRGGECGLRQTAVAAGETDAKGGCHWRGYSG